MTNYPINIEKSNEYGSTNEEAISVFDRFIGANLPKDYREFLKKFNGGSPQPNKVNNISSVDHFYGLVRKPNWADLVWEYNTFRGRIPERMISIGSDPLGNQFLLSLKTEDRESVYFWDHEMEVDEDEPPILEQITLLSKSFTEFLKSLS